MTQDSTSGVCKSSGYCQRMAFFSIVWIVFWGIGQLVIVGYMHRDNNYGLRPGDYSVRTMDAVEFARLTPEQQIGWDSISGSDKYVLVYVKNPFVFSQVSPQLIMNMIFAMLALFWYVRGHGLPTLVVNPIPKVNSGVPHSG